MTNFSFSATSRRLSHSTAHPQATHEQAPPQPSQQDDRAALTARTIPLMSLSTASNPLTAPLPSISTPNSTATQRALSRFGTPGHAVLTGGAGTLALASASALLDHGTRQICLLDLSSTLSSSHDQISELRSQYPASRIHCVECDVTSEDSVASAFDRSASLMENQIDLLCCFAGIVGCVHASEMTAKQWRKVIDVNLTGSFLCAQAAARQMMAQNKRRIAALDPSGGQETNGVETNGHHSPTAAATTTEQTNGHSQNDIVTTTNITQYAQGIPGYSILFTSSISGHTTNYPQPQAAYNASKTALQSLTKSLAAEWNVHGIRVNSISPGYLDTVLNAGDGLEKVREVWAGRCPMGRMGQVEEVTGAVVFMSSIRAARYMTGADVVVDGGAMCF